MSKILLIDDDANVLAALQRALLQMFAAAPPQIESYVNPYQALERICAVDFDLVICDYMMPQMTGGELLQVLKEVAPNTVRIMLSASTEYGTLISAINQAGAFRFMSKPWDAAELERNVRQALAQRPAPTPQEQEARRLEAEEPGLLQVRRDADGSVIL
ncbi:Response regulator receiver domain-containing protein [Duganella sp. CF402]|uniref:response regulator n=1 Tax=unclassified Duganella TaxID=2636909 RepID=UPI0008B87004|nr:MULTISPECIES: response regulator [unclassified Duganella]RZT11351.1 response regulator receiver domain-containing protein [Duganella sp. BK701]SEK68823.1 Response regulator receiver domain-containing protein [Duganella sp. CF402]